MTHRSDHWLLVLVLSAALIGLTASPPIARAQLPSRAGLVVRLEDGQAITRCVQFDEPAISGQDVLLRSGLEVVADGQAICDIEGQSGCSAANCFCRCQASSCLYWSYWHLVGGDWQSSGVGAGDYQVQDRDVEGWSWGTGAPPPAMTFGRICLPVSIYLPLAYRP
jgi:hypothetical protein